MTVISIVEYSCLVYSTKTIPHNFKKGIPSCMSFTSPRYEWIACNCRNQFINVLLCTKVLLIYSDLKFQMHFYADCSALSRNCLEALLATFSASAQLLYNDWDLSKVLIILRYDTALLCYKLQMMNNWRVQLPSTSWKIVSSLSPSLIVFLG